MIDVLVNVNDYILLNNIVIEGCKNKATLVKRQPCLEVPQLRNLMDYSSAAI